MTGVVFLISIPSKEQEEILINKVRKRTCSRQNSNSSKQSVRIDENKLNSSENVGSNTQCSMSSDCTGRLDSLNVQNIDEAEINKTETSMEQILTDVLKRLKIANFTWSRCSDNKNVQIIFPVESRDRYEQLLEVLKANGVGKRFHSIVSVVPCSIYYHSRSEPVEELDNVLDDDSEEINCKMKESAWNRFVTSIRARLTVAQVVENIRADALLTFDFVCLLVIATIMCAIGLTENSDVYLLSSMLISPMMGPVMAGTFGTVIRDTNLQKTGVLNELIGLGIATLIGFLYGVIICSATDKYGDKEWPTLEMIARGEVRTLWVGCLIALLSGAAVALGILGDNIASLVGVAISTSLMPPAVNAGLLWSISLICYMSNNTKNLTHTEFYSKNQVLELSSMGAISMSLTFVNIICIYLAGILVFKIKEVTPLASKDSARRRFWKYDIKIARDYNKTLQNDEAKNFIRQFSKETDYQSSNVHPYGFYKKMENEHFCHSVNFPESKPKVNVRYQQTWSPWNNPEQREFQYFRGTSKKILQFNLPPSGDEMLQRNLTAIFASSSRENNHGQSGTSRMAQDAVDHEKYARIGKPKSRISKNYFCGTKTFTVTPCTSDAINENELIS